MIKYVILGKNMIFGEDGVLKINYFKNNFLRQS